MRACWSYSTPTPPVSLIRITIWMQELRPASPAGPQKFTVWDPIGTVEGQLSGCNRYQESARSGILRAAGPRKSHIRLLRAKQETAHETYSTCPHPNMHSRAFELREIE